MNEPREVAVGVVLAALRRDPRAVDELLGREPFVSDPKLLEAYAVIDSLAAMAGGLAVQIAADHGIEPEAFLRRLALQVAGER